MTLIEDTRAFMQQLAAHNNRDWFNANKAQYDARVKRPATALLDEMAARLEELTGAQVRPKLYRIHRDLRFSRDKTPYNTHLHLQWSAGDGVTSWLFGISNDYVCAGTGAMGFEREALTRWREAVAGEPGAALAAELAGLMSQGQRIDPPALKRVPPPFDKDHPRADLLRRKGLVVWADLDPAAREDLSETLMRIFTRHEGLRKQLSRMLAAPKPG